MHISVLEEIGGNAANPGPLSVVWFYFNDYSFIYWFLLYYFLVKMSDLNIHPFWKYFLISTFSYGPSNNIIMSYTAFTFVVIFLLKTETPIVFIYLSLLFNFKFL